MRRAKIRVTLALALALALGVPALLPLVAKPNEPREVHLVARRMAFYLANGAGGANPVIRVAPGERVRLTFVNHDAGFEHDLAVKAWGLATPTLDEGGRASLVIQAPDTPGQVPYVCTLHAVTMRGLIEVTTTGS